MNAYAQGMTKSFSASKNDDDKFFDVGDQGRNTDVKALTQSGYST